MAPCDTATTSSGTLSSGLPAIDGGFFTMESDTPAMLRSKRLEGLAARRRRDWAPSIRPGASLAP